MVQGVALRYFMDPDFRPRLVSRSHDHTLVKLRDAVCNEKIGPPPKLPPFANFGPPSENVNSKQFIR